MTQTSVQQEVTDQGRDDYMIPEIVNSQEPFRSMERNIWFSSCWIVVLKLASCLWMIVTYWSSSMVLEDRSKELEELKR